MSMRAHLLIFFAGFAVTEARVTFPYSEVLQLNDLVNKAAPFNCDNGCKVYVNRVDESLYISQNGHFIATFKDIVGNNYFEPTGIVLTAGKNYKLQSINTPTADFVFYAVSQEAPNYGSPVFVPQEKLGISANRHAQFFTILSSFNAIEVYGFNGTFPTGYPKIYATGFDAADDTKCTPVFQGRSQYNAEQSRPDIFSPILTVDYGYVGKHGAMAHQKDGKKPPMKTSASSTVYMSPGYVGCSSVGNQVYHSSVKSVEDHFTQAANSLDITAVYNAVSPDEPVRFSVNHDDLTFFYFGSSSFKKHYDKGSFDVDLSWTRATPGSSWALQLDFGIVPDPVPSTTTIASKPSSPAMGGSTTAAASNPSSSGTTLSTTSSVIGDFSTTSKSGRRSTLFVVVVVVAVLSSMI